MKYEFAILHNPTASELNAMGAKGWHIVGTFKVTPTLPGVYMQRDIEAPMARRLFEAGLVPMDEPIGTSFHNEPPTLSDPALDEMWKEASEDSSRKPDHD